MKDVAAAAGVSQGLGVLRLQRITNACRRSGASTSSPWQPALDTPGPTSPEAVLRLGRIGAVGVLIPGSLSLAVEDPSTMLLVRGIVEVGELADVALTLLPVDAQRGSRQRPGKSRRSCAGWSTAW